MRKSTRNTGVIAFDLLLKRQHIQATPTPAPSSPIFRQESTQPEKMRENERQCRKLLTRLSLPHILFVCLNLSLASSLYLRTQVLLLTSGNASLGCRHSLSQVATQPFSRFLLASAIKKGACLRGVVEFLETH